MNVSAIVFLLHSLVLSCDFAFGLRKKTQKLFTRLTKTMYQYLHVLGKFHLTSVAPAIPNSVVITRTFTFSHNLRCDFFSNRYLLWKRLSSFSNHWELFISFLAVVIQPNFAETRDNVCYKIPSFKNCVGWTCIPTDS